MTGVRPRVAIITDELGWHTDQLVAAWRAQGFEAQCVDAADCYIDMQAAASSVETPSGGAPEVNHRALGWRLADWGAALPVAVMVRGLAGGSFEQVTQRLGLLHVLQHVGIPIYNEARAIERSVDKAMTSVLLRWAGIPTPDVWVSENLAQARAWCAAQVEAQRCWVMKPVFGSQGKGLRRIAWVDGKVHGLPEALDADSPWGGLVYAQAYVPPVASPGHDWRVLVVGGRAVACMRRESEHWVHNVARGAACRAETLTPDLAAIAEGAAQALGLDYAGVDIMPSATGAPLQVIEVNGVAAWRGLQSVTPFNIAEALVADVIRKMGRGA